MKQQSWMLGALALTLVACGGGTQAKRSKQGGSVPLEQSAAGIDAPQCEFRGRDDRIAAVSLALGASQPNVRRVYDVAPGAFASEKTLRCRELDSNFDGVKDVVRVYNEEGQLLAEQADTNYDGKVDTWITFARSRVVKIEVDHNGDGRPDEFKEYVAGRLVKVQRDSNYDGRVDTWEVYEDGRLNRIGVDLDGDEKVDRWYRDRELVLAEEAEAAAEAAESNAAEQTESQPAEEEDTF